MYSKQNAFFTRICSATIRTNKSAAELAEYFNTSVRTIERAREWGRKTGFYSKDAADTLQVLLHKLREQEQWLDSQLKLYQKHSTKTEDYICGKTGKQKKRTVKYPLDHKVIAVISSQLLDVQIKIAEFEGVYKNVINVHHSADSELLEKLDAVRGKHDVPG